MKRALFALLLAAVLTLTACGSSPKREVSQALDLDVSSGTVLHHEDGHGGFLGDGSTAIVLSFPDAQLAESIRTDSRWKPLPPDPTAQILLYGTEEDGPYLIREDGTPMVPEIENGHYCLIDRQEPQSTPMLDRYSLNFTLAVYDTEEHLLYYCTMDT